jgi:hypothetical protein
MKDSLLASVFAATLLLLSGCANLSVPEKPPLTLEQIVDLARQGKDAPTLIGEIKQSHAVYDVTASQYAKLSRDGVPDAVLDFMQQGQIRMAERAGRREARQDLWMYGVGWPGYGPVWYPRSYYVYIRGRPYLQQW